MDEELTAGTETEEVTEPVEDEVVSSEFDIATVNTIVEVVDLDRPIMTTPLNDYSVVEGLLLLLVLLKVVQICIGIIKGGFYWLFS